MDSKYFELRGAPDISVENKKNREGTFAGVHLIGSSTNATQEKNVVIRRWFWICASKKTMKSTEKFATVHNIALKLETRALKMSESVSYLHHGFVGLGSRLIYGF